MVMGKIGGFSVLSGLLLGALAGCSDGGSSPCPSCGPGLVCSEAEKRCVPEACLACGSNTSCDTSGVCRCAAGFFDCNGDLDQGGNGCECAGGCNGTLCSGGCDPTTPLACGGSFNFCDDGVCAACAAGSYNCDGVGACEASESCSQSCSPTVPNDCQSDGHYCNRNDGKCTPCPPNGYNCDGVNECEASAPCGGTCSPTVAFDCETDDTFCEGNVCKACPVGTRNCEGLGPCETTGPCGGCTQLDSWPVAASVGAYMDFGGGVEVTYVELHDSGSASFNMLRIEDFHFDGNHPKTVTFSSNDNSIDCDLCVSIGEDCTSDYESCATIRFVQGGTLTITQADTLLTGGRMVGSASNLKLVQWNENEDKAVPAGACTEIANLTFDISW